MNELQSTRLTYRILRSEDVSETYINWLNNPVINRYLETRHTYQTMETCREFVNKMYIDKAQHLFGMFLREDQLHIGNIKLGFINTIYSTAQLSLFIGDVNYWGKGIGVEAIKTITQWGFQELGLYKIEAGCYDKNIASLRAFLKVGYQVEGYFRKNIVFEGDRIGIFWMGILPNEIK